MARKGQFKKGGGRVGGGSGSAKRRSGGADSATAIVVMPSRAVRSNRKSAPKSHYHKHKGAKHRRRRGGSGGASGVTPMKIAVGALVLSSAAGTNNGPLGGKVYDLVQKIPGAKTLGGAATAGLVLGALGKYTGIGGPKIKPWLKAAGVIGLVLAAAKVGEAGTAFKWLGDDEVYGNNDQIMDVET